MAYPPAQRPIQNPPQSHSLVPLSELQQKDICVKTLNAGASFSHLQRCLNHCMLKGCRPVASFVQLFNIFNCLVLYFKQAKALSTSLALLSVNLKLRHKDRCCLAPLLPRGFDSEPGLPYSPQHTAASAAGPLALYHPSATSG